METYKGTINEFVDWSTGIDSRTNLNVTQNLQPSGKSIKELIQSHLQKPFVKYDDVTGGQYLFFSSEEAKNEWIRLTDSESPYYDLEKASTLPIATMSRPSDTIVDVKSVNTDNSEGDIGDSRYVISGDVSSEAADIRYVVRMFKEQAGTQQNTVDSFTVTYTTTNASGAVHTDVDEYNSSQVTTTGEKKILSYNCYDHLSEGTNNINLIVASKNSGAIFSTNITVYLIKFQLSSTFQFQKAVSYGGIIRIPVTITRSVTGMTMNINVKVADGSQQNPVFTTVASTTTNSSDNPYTTTIEVQNTFAANATNADHIKHTLSIEATLGSGGSATQFTSNILYFNFETASAVTDIVNKFINIKYDTPANQVYSQNGNIILYAKQYEPFSLDWAYYTDHLNFDSSIDVLWYLRYKDGAEYNEMFVGSGTGIKEPDNAPQLKFIPEIAQSIDDGATLVAKYVKNSVATVIDSFPIIISQSSYNIQETSDAVFKLSAFGKSNQSEDKNSWVDTISGASTLFNNFTYDDRAGWNDNGLMVQGTGVTAVINYCPLPAQYTLQSSGKTIEIDFMPTKSNNDSDVLIRIGAASAGHIDIKPNGAYLYIGDSSTDVVHTNYKVGERIKLAFVFNLSNNSDPYTNGLVYIINNGILERAAEMGYPGSYTSDEGNITIGGTNSGVRVYMIRAYNKPLTYQQELNNYIFDSTNKSVIISRNQLFANDQINFDLAKNKIDSILIEGLPGETYHGLTGILSRESTKDSSEITVNIKRTCISDDSKSFYISKAMIRKHGQSTINYPITSLKFWLNKSATVGDNPSFIELPERQRALNLNKNRYVMKNGAIPANKFVLQANYADSSGVHNGSMLRLINDTWYNATFGQNNEYKLRTAPQLFTSGYTVAHNNVDLGEDGTWIEGYGVGAATNKTWPQLTGTEFPYKIRNAADSFPCAVFYKDPEGDGLEHFLGQYVFMDDKKSDFIYGERSIYAFGDYSDPFVLNIDNTKNGVNGKQDVAANRVWNNNNVLRIEIVLPNTKVTSYMDMNVPTTMELDNEGNIVSTGGSQVPCTDIKYDLQGNPIKFYWEDYFEMIYPDADDLEEGKFEQNSEFRQKAQPFIDFLTWITGIAALNVNGNNEQYHDGTVTTAALNKFKEEAHDHLDLYKLAAYYVFFLRFGLVDSVERNAQLKTYDGQHWHYEPWDMDIALGNTNQGALVLNPPLTRDSVVPGTSTKAFSGRGESTSNFMWDCLEAWDYWANTLVPEVAGALYDAGLSYENVSKMFDENYSDKWAESLYNEAGYFKYIKNGGGDYLKWLQGARTSHRHWWLSTSMNYYDAKWSCGTFKTRRVVLFVDKGISPAGTDIVSIKPTSNTFFEITSSGGESSIEKKEALSGTTATFDISANSFSAKDPTWIYGGSFIEELNLSCFAKTMATVDVSLCYDNVLGANIKKLNIGVPTSGTSSLKTGTVSGTQLRISSVNTLTGADALSVVKEINITGQSSVNNTQGLFVSQDRTSIEKFYAAGTSLAGFQNAPSGNTFVDLVLPGKTEVTNADLTVSTSNINSFVMHSAQWSNLEFWDTEATSTPTQVLDENNEPVYTDDGSGNLTPVYTPASATYTKRTSIPSTIATVTFDGSTARNECSLQFVLDWIHSIATTLSSYDSTNDTWTASELHTALKQKQFRAENINWLSTFTTRLTYDDLENMAYLNGTTTVGGTEVFNNSLYRYIKGYVVVDGTLDSVKMANIKKWFGDAAFDKSARNSQLVVDSTNENVIINVDGATVSGQDLNLQEGNIAYATATKFLLRDSVGNNTVSTDLSGIQADEYRWSIGYGSTWGSSYKSCSIEYNESDGRMKITAGEGDYGDYDMQIKVSYLNQSGGGSIVSDVTLTLHIIGTIYPTSYQLSVTGTDLRELHVPSATKSSIFGSYVQYASQNVDSYVLYTPNQEMTLTVVPQGTFNARIKKIEFNIIDTSSNLSVTNSYQDVRVINQAGSSTMQGSSVYIGYNGTSSQPDGIKIVAGQTLPSSCTGFQVRIGIQAGARAAQYVVLNIAVIDDGTPIVQANANSGMYLTLFNKYITTYSLPNVYTNLYKTHLLGITGALDFTSYTSQTSTLFANGGVSVFTYLPNITSIDLTGCTALQDNASVFNFSNISGLTSVSLNGCSALLGVVDLTGALGVTSLDLRGTTCGVAIPQGSAITTLQLGTPTSVSITQPASLTSGGISIQSSSGLNSLSIQLGSNATGGFTMFNNLYNPS